VTFFVNSSLCQVSHFLSFVISKRKEKLYFTLSS